MTRGAHGGNSRRLAWLAILAVGNHSTAFARRNPPDGKLAVASLTQGMNHPFEGREDVRGQGDILVAGTDLHSSRKLSAFLGGHKEHVRDWLLQFIAPGVIPVPAPESGAAPIPAPESGAAPIPAPESGAAPIPAPESGAAPIPAPAPEPTPTA